MTMAPTTNRVAYHSAIRRPNARVTAGRQWRSRAEDIANAAHRVQQFLLEGTIDLVAQPAHEHVDDVGLRIEAVRPDVREDHRLRYDPAAIPHQVLEERELARPQIQRLAVAGHAAREEIENQ